MGISGKFETEEHNMLLGSMSFVKNCQFSDYIIDKIKEDQEKRDRKEAKKLRKNNNKKITPLKTDASFIKNRNVKFDDGQTEKFDGKMTQQDVERRNKISDETKCHQRPIYYTIETFDGFVVDIDMNRNKIILTQKISSSICCHFERVVWEENGSSGGTTKRTEALQLKADPSFYICHSGQKLEIGNIYTSPDVNDSRWFLVDENSEGFSNLQPLGKRGSFVHHFDDELSIRRLDVNWRPPEEYLFRFLRVDSGSDVVTAEEAEHQVDLDNKRRIQSPETTNFGGKKQRWQIVKSTVSKWRRLKANQNESKVKVRR